MKAVVMSIAVLMVVVLLGCTEQSQMTGPVAMSNNSSPTLAKAQEFKIDTKIVGPGGFKYAVVGTIDYALKTEGETITLATTMTLKIAQSGSGEEHKVSGGKIFSFNRGPGKTDFVSESYAIGSVAESSHRIWIQYSVADNVVNLNDLKIISGDPD